MAYDQHVNPPTPVGGSPSTIRVAEVVTVNQDGTVDLRPLNSRATKVAVTVQPWYVPTVGDRVLIADLNGDAQTPVMVGFHGHRDGTQAAPPQNRFRLPTYPG